MLGLMTHKVAAEMQKPEVNDFFARLIQRTSPKSYIQVNMLPLLPPFRLVISFSFSYSAPLSIS